MEPLTWIRVGVPEDDAADAFEQIEAVLHEAGILSDIEYIL